MLKTLPLTDDEGQTDRLTVYMWQNQINSRWTEKEVHQERSKIDPSSKRTSEPSLYRVVFFDACRQLIPPMKLISSIFNSSPSFPSFSIHQSQSIKFKINPDPMNWLLWKYIQISLTNHAQINPKLAKLVDKYKFGLQKETCCIQTNLRPNQKESFRPECVVNFAQLRRVLEPGWNYTTGQSGLAWAQHLHCPLTKL